MRVRNILINLFFLALLLALLYMALLHGEEIDSIGQKQYLLPDKVTEYREPSGRVLMMEATAYDLSIQCCGKPYGHPARGITASGYNLNDITRERAMTISSNDFPMGTELELVFDEAHSQFNGIYTVRDTGKMKPEVIDVFVGDFGEQVSQEATIFGRQNVEVRIIEDL